MSPPPGPGSNPIAAFVFVGRIQWQKESREGQVDDDYNHGYGSATVTVGQHYKEWGDDNALGTMIPLMMTKMTRTTMKKEGGWDPPHPW